MRGRVVAARIASGAVPTLQKSKMEPAEGEEMKHKVFVFRTECAEIEVEAESPEAAREKVKQEIEAADCIADLDYDWDIDGGIKIESEFAEYATR